MQLSLDGGKINIRHIEGGENYTEFYFIRNFTMPENCLKLLFENFRQNLKFLPAPNGDGIRIYHAGGDILQNAKNILKTLMLILPAKQQ